MWLIVADCERQSSENREKLVRCVRYCFEAAHLLTPCEKLVSSARNQGRHNERNDQPLAPSDAGVGVRGKCCEKWKGRSNTNPAKTGGVWCGRPRHLHRRVAAPNEQVICCPGWTAEVSPSLPQLGEFPMEPVQHLGLGRVDRPDRYVPLPGTSPGSRFATARVVHVRHRRVVAEPQRLPRGVDRPAGRVADGDLPDPGADRQFVALR